MNNMKTILLATANPYEIEEYLDMFSRNFPSRAYHFISLKDLPFIPEPYIKGDNIRDIVWEKAMYYSQQFGLPTIADYSILRVNLLNNEPDLNTFEYAGETGLSRMAKNREKLKKRLKEAGVITAQAIYHCVCAYVDLTKSISMKQPAPIFQPIFHGKMPVIVCSEERGKIKYEYDTMSYLDDGKTLAELSIETKNQISHRHKALVKMKNYLKLENYRCGFEDISFETSEITNGVTNLPLITKITKQSVLSSL